MNPFPNRTQAMCAWQTTRDALNLAQDTVLGGHQISVFFKHLLLQGMGNDDTVFSGKSTLTSLRDQLQFRLTALHFALRLKNDFIENLGLDSQQAWQAIHSSKVYQQRLIDLALATLFSRNLAPELCLEPEAWPSNKCKSTFQDSRNHAIIFADSIMFHHEYYPLAVDAYVRDSQDSGVTRTHVLGVHVDWISADGMIKRILFLDVESGCLRETDLAFPLLPDSVQFHSLGKNERKLHQDWSAAFSCPQVNPYAQSSLADDKAATLMAWESMGVEIPAFVKLVESDFESAWRFVGAYREIVAKPNQSTEGDRVAYFNVGQHNFKTAFAKHLEACWVHGDAIIQERRDGLIFVDARSGAQHNLVLRLNLSFDGSRYQVESGYVQLSVDTEHPAASSQGGRIASPMEILGNLSSRTNPASPIFRIESQDWRRICDQAVWAASLFRGLMLVGIDVLLDVDLDGKIMPVFLEANPRPAGLCHSHLVDGYPDSCQAPNGVSLKLWDGLELLHDKASRQNLLKPTASSIL